MNNLKFSIIALLLTFFSYESNAQSRPNITTFSVADRQLLATEMQIYIDADVLITHTINDASNVVGQIHYKDDIIPFHKLYIEGLEDYLYSKGLTQFIPFPYWDPMNPIPVEFQRVDSDCSSLSPTLCSDPTNTNPYEGWNTQVIGPDLLGNQQGPLDLSDWNSTHANMVNPLDFNSYIGNWSNIHGLVHGAISGNMGGTLSPASLVFWLWHAYLDDIGTEKSCNTTSFNFPNMASEGLSMNDALNINYVFDFGTQPSQHTFPNNSDDWLKSPDIWIRNSNDSIQTHQDPIEGAVNYIYVRIRNRSCTTQTGHNLLLAWAKATGTLEFPNDFNNTSTAGFLNGNTINSQSIPSIGAGEQYILEIPWSPVNSFQYINNFGANFNEFTILATINDYSIPTTFNVKSEIIGKNSVSALNVKTTQQQPITLTTAPPTCAGTCSGSVSVAINNNATITSYAWSDGISGSGSPQNRSGFCPGPGSLTIYLNNTSVTYNYTVAPATSYNSYWHQTTNNTNNNADNVLKVVSDPASNEVYVLGEFIDETSLDGGVSYLDADATGTNTTQKGIFVAKYDPCGTLLWSVNSQKTGTTNSMDIEGIDIQLTGNGVRVFGKFEVPYLATFNLSSINNNTIVVANGNSAKDIFSFDVTSLGTITTTSLEFYPLNFTDIIHQVNYLVNGDAIFAGQFNSFAGVKVYDYTSSQFTDAIMDNIPGNDITAFTQYNNEIFAVANFPISADFGLGTIYSNAIQESVILHSSNNQVINMVTANSNNFVHATDIVIDPQQNIWVSMQYQGVISGWSALTSNLKTGMVAKFNYGLNPVSSFHLDPHSQGLQESSANALAINGTTLYTAGTFTGLNIAIGNNQNGYTSASFFAGLNLTSDLWMAKTITTAPVFSWIQGTNSVENVEVTDIAFDGLHAHVTGNYKSTINASSKGLTYPGQTNTPLGFVMRGGDLNTNTPKFYKTDGDNSATKEVNSNLNSDVSNQLVISPNPNQGTFDFQYENSMEGDLNVTIYNVTGKTVYHQTHHKSTGTFNQSISLTQLQAGIYLMSIDMNGTLSYQKFIIK
tara:strand:- start:1234 stop:4419 length:3186 start_codon:yes stop_codon:yes gene_type:complete